MIGYSKTARTRYHQGYERHKEFWATCDAIILTYIFPDDREDDLRDRAPDLTRCPACWPKGAI